MSQARVYSQAALGRVTVAPRVNYRFTTPQSTILTSPAKYTAAIAGFGSGKTLTLVRRLLLTMFENPGVNQAYLALTHSDIKIIFYPVISYELERLGVRHSINRAENVVHIPGAGYIFCKSMQEPENIVGFSCGDVFIDEIDLLPAAKAQVVLNKATARARQIYPSGKKNQIWIGSTPEGFKFAYKNFRKAPLDDSVLVKMPTYSNPYLPADYVDTLRKLYPAAMLAAYLEGEFINLTQGVCIYTFDRTQHHDARRLEADDRTVWVSCDFNVGNMSATVYVPTDYGACAVHEFTRLIDTPHLVQAVKDLANGRSIVWFPDASGGSRRSQDASTTDLKLLKQVGTVDAPSANPAIKDRVLDTNLAFERGAVRVNTHLCPETTEALEQQPWAENGEIDKKFHLNDNFDGATYFISRKFGVSRPRTTVHALPV